MKRVIIFSRSDLARDPRVYREIEALSDYYTVIPIGFNPPKDGFPEAVELAELLDPSPQGRSRLDKVKYLIRTRGLFSAVGKVINAVVRRLPLPAPARLWVRRHFLEARLIRRIRMIECDLILSNDLSGLVACAAAKGKRKLIYDAHEYSPGQYGEGRKAERNRALAVGALRKYLPACDATLTVSEGIADEYQWAFGIKRPEIILNAPHHADKEPFSRKDGKIRLVHHGVAGRLRQLEILIDMMGMLDSRFELDFYLVRNEESYYEELLKKARGSKRIRFLDPVPMPAIPDMLNQYDLGLAFFPPITINLKYVLPNKFFEFVQGRIGVAIGPSPEMARYVRELDLGVIAEDFSAEALARSISGLNEGDIARFKRNAHAHAYALSAEPQMQKLRDLVVRILEDPENNKC